MQPRGAYHETNPRHASKMQLGRLQRIWGYIKYLVLRKVLVPHKGRQQYETSPKQDSRSRHTGLGAQVCRSHGRASKKMRSTVQEASQVLQGPSSVWDQLRQVQEYEIRRAQQTTMKES